MIDLGRKLHLRGLEGIVGGESKGKKEDTARIRGIGRAHNGCLPLEKIVIDGTSRARRRGVTSEVDEFLVDALQSHIAGSSRRKFFVVVGQARCRPD